VVELTRNLPAGSSAFLPTTDVNSLGGILLTPQASLLPPDIVEAIKLSLSHSITYMFLIGSIFVLAAWVISFFIRSVPLKNEDEYHERPSSEEKVSKE
jgi:hypothetical protein